MDKDITDKAERVNASGERMFVLHYYGGCAPLTLVDPNPPNGRSQKTVRKIRRRLSNAPRAIQRKYKFKAVRHG